MCSIRVEETSEFLRKLEQSEMHKVYRTRVRTRLHGPRTCFKRIHDSVTHRVVTNQDAEIITKVLPERGLNEVFIGELDSTEPSHLEMEVDHNGETKKIKCSGKIQLL